MVFFFLGIVRGVGYADRALTSTCDLARRRGALGRLWRVTAAFKMLSQKAELTGQFNQRLSDIDFIGLAREFETGFCVVPTFFWRTHTSHSHCGNASDGGVFRTT